MKPLHENKAGTFLYRYYQKRSASFWLNICKAGITATENDIHKARVDLKKLFALFVFFDVLSFEKIKSSDPRKLFNNIYNAAGEIREIQMNLLYLESLQRPDADLQLFSTFLKSNLKSKIKKFIQSIIKLDEKKFDQLRRTIRKSCKELNVEKIISKCDHFFMIHSKKIKKYRLDTSIIENVHKIRKEMKKISEVAGLLKLTRTDEFIENLITSLNDTEMYIGDWHDKVVLYNSIDSFIQKNEKCKEGKCTSLENLKNSMIKDADALLKKILPGVDKVVDLIDHMSLSRNIN